MFDGFTSTFSLKPAAVAQPLGVNSGASLAIDRKLVFLKIRADGPDSCRNCATLWPELKRGGGGILNHLFSWSHLKFKMPIFFN